MSCLANTVLFARTIPINDSDWIELQISCSKAALMQLRRSKSNDGILPFLSHPSSSSIVIVDINLDATFPFLIDVSYERRDIDEGSIILPSSVGGWRHVVVNAVDKAACESRGQGRQR